MEKEIRDRLLIYFGVKNHKVLMLEEILAEWGGRIEDGLFQELI